MALDGVAQLVVELADAAEVAEVAELVMLPPRSPTEGFKTERLPGPFGRTCDECRIVKGLFGRKALHCRCSTPDGGRVRSVLPSLHRCTRDIHNCDGALTCGACTHLVTFKYLG